MPYTPTDWVDFVDPPIDAINLNNIEAGIVAATRRAETETISADWLWSTNKKIQFRDAQIYIHSPIDGTLFLEADGFIDLSASVRLNIALGKLEFFTAGAWSVNLYPDSANVLRTDDSLFVSSNLYIGSLNTVLYESAANVLETTDRFQISDNFLYFVDQSLSTNIALLAAVQGEAQDRFLIRTDGLMQWGSGAAARDTESSRIGANVLGMSSGDAFRAGNYVELVDGIAAPGANVGFARIYVDTADGDLKVVFGDGFVATIAADS